MVIGLAVAYGALYAKIHFAASAAADAVCMTADPL